MKRHLIICTALLLVLLTACSRQPGKTAAQDLTVIDLETALKNPQGEMKLSDLYTSVRYVPLETNDSCLVGDYPSVREAGDRLLILSSAPTNPWLSFDRQTGQFIATVGHTGQDPEACTGYAGYHANDGLLYFSREPDGLQKYDTEGGYHGLIKLPTTFPMPAQWAFADSLIVGCQSNRWPTVSECALLSFTPDGQLKDSISDSYAVAGYDSIKAPNGRISLKQLAGNVQMALTTFGGEVAWNTINGGSVYAYGNEVKYYGDFSDTVYVLKDGRLQPSIAFHTGSYHFPAEGRTRTTGYRDKVVITQVTETPQSIRFYCSRAIYSEKPENYYGIYNRNTGRLRLLTIGKEIEDDLAGFLPYKGNLIGAYEAVTWLEEHPEAKDTPALAPLLQLKEEDNPVVVVGQQD